MLVDQDDSGNSVGNQNRCSTARVPVCMFLCVYILRCRGADRTESGPAFSSGSSQGSSAAGLTPQAQRLRESLAGFFDQLYRSTQATGCFKTLPVVTN